VAVVVAASLGGAAVARAGGPAPASGPTRFEPPDGQRYLGVSTEGPGAALTRFLTASGRTSVAIYNRWSEAMGPFDWILREFAAHPDVTGMISWNLPGTGSQRSVADGAVDPYLRARVAELRAYGRPVFLRINWEFNGCYYAWSSFDCAGGALPGNAPGDYVAAWRHVAKLVAPARNVTLVWSPTLFPPLPAGHGLHIWDYYPGDDVVGWIGMDAYPGSAPWAVMQHGPEGMDAIYAFAVDHHRPVMIAEWGLNNQATGDDPAWVNVELAWVESHPEVKAALYFDYDNRPQGGKDYRLADFPVAAAALRHQVASPSWLSSLCSSTCQPPGTG